MRSDDRKPLISEQEHNFAMDCFYLWCDERATLFCEWCLADTEMGEFCACGDPVWYSEQLREAA